MRLFQYEISLAVTYSEVLCGSYRYLGVQKMPKEAMVLVATFLSYHIIKYFCFIFVVLRTAIAITNNRC